MSRFQTLIIDCLRHGECEGPRHCLRGHTNVALSAEGRMRMLAAAEQLPTPDLVITSPLVRCADVADTLAKQWGVPCQTLTDIAEMNFGDWDGVAIDELLGHSREALERFWHDPAAHPPPRGEHLEEFLHRTERGWQQIIESGLTLAGDKTVRLLVCSHAGVIKSWVAQRLGMSTHRALYLHRLDLPYAGLARIRVDIDITRHERFEQLCWLGGINPSG